ncbi:carbamoyltransferase C-terminal domain-containing protein [Nocardia anaemiae]|uniref:carbamoyltransferase C-terminal domain-containing protein n=1 Tax=Nocardia anaemiae TaxID=263910 RepID=UPI0007A38D64|nr:carbamoyltransferase C-terminal domain-containing protein [Nocardia anaemiae]
MRDGFYLSTYLNPAGIHRVLNVRMRHDNNIALWRKSGKLVELVHHWELERLSGQKMHRTPFSTLDDERNFINELLASVGIGISDLVEVWGTPDIDTTDDYHLVREVPDIAFHSVAHLYSAVLLDSEVFFDGTIVGLAIDRGPDILLDRRIRDSWFAGCVVRQGDIKIFPVESPGSLYCEGRDYFGMREGSLMALATASKAFGECDCDAIMAEFRFDGRDVIDQSRRAFDIVCDQVRQTLTTDPNFTEVEGFASAVMKEVQAISVMVMRRNVDTILRRYDIDPTQAHLALAGGYALNCPTNSLLMAEYGFRGLLAPPSVGDDGQAVGIGLTAFHKKFGGRFNFRYPGPYLGRADDDLAAALAQFDGHIDAVDDYQDDVAVQDLRSGPIAWFSGASEVGPRALGNRSLLADPTSEDTKDQLNTIKRREWWRPVAPTVLEDRLAEWFIDARPSPYMLETFMIRPEARGRIPAVAHLDYSARIQSVNVLQNPALHRLIAAFDRQTGVPMLCNTSLNDKGEPIIDTMVEALAFCLRRRVQVAYLNGKRIGLRDFESFRGRDPWPRNSRSFAHVPDAVAEKVRREANPHGLTDLQLFLYQYDLDLGDRIDIRTAEGADAVRRELDARLAANPSLRESAERTMERNAVHFSAYGWHPLIPHRRQ